MTTLTAVGKFKTPWKVGATEALDIEFREATLKEMLAAEAEANPQLSPNAFNVALACETCVRAGTFTGPFAPAQFHSMTQKQWMATRKAMNEAADLGEG